MSTKVVGAYGRRYVGAYADIEARSDWFDDKDFQMVVDGAHGPYINKQDADNHLTFGFPSPYPIVVMDRLTASVITTIHSKDTR